MESFIEIGLTHKNRWRYCRSWKFSTLLKIEILKKCGIDPTRFLSAAKSTELFGSISMLYASVVPIGKLMLMLTLVKHAVAGCNESQIDLLRVCWLFCCCLTDDSHTAL